MPLYVKNPIKILCGTIYVLHVSLVSPLLLPLAAQNLYEYENDGEKRNDGPGADGTATRKLAGRTRSQSPLANRAQSARARGKLVVRPNAAVDNGS